MYEIFVSSRTEPSTLGYDTRVDIRIRKKKHRHGKWQHIASLHGMIAFQERRVW